MLCRNFCVLLLLLALVPTILGLGLRYPVSSRGKRDENGGGNNDDWCRPHGRLPFGSPFTGWSKVGQTAYGTFFGALNLPPPIPQYNGTGPAVFVIDPVHKGYFLNLTLLGGIQWTLENGTYVQFASGCTFDATYGTYDKQVESYSQVLKIGQYDSYGCGFGGCDFYLGMPNDFGTCGLGISTNFLINPENGALVSQTFSQWVGNTADLGWYTTVGTINLTRWDFEHIQIPPLPEACWSLNVNNPSSLFCDVTAFPEDGYNDQP